MKEKNGNKGIKILAICAVISLMLIVACVFFPDEIFGIFLKK